MPRVCVSCVFFFFLIFFFFQAEDGIRDWSVTGVQTCAFPICNNRVGAIGYCLGGHLSYRLAASADLNAGVSYYGVQIEEYLDRIDKIEEPMLLHIAGEDEFVDKEAQAKILQAVDGKPHIHAHVYEGQDHAFARGNGMHYNEEAATLANTRTQEFLKEHLSA